MNCDISSGDNFARDIGGLGHRNIQDELFALNKLCCDLERERCFELWKTYLATYCWTMRGEGNIG